MEWQLRVIQSPVSSSFTREAPHSVLTQPHHLVQSLKQPCVGVPSPLADELSGVQGRGRVPHCHPQGPGPSALTADLSVTCEARAFLFECEKDNTGTEGL